MDVALNTLTFVLYLTTATLIGVKVIKTVPVSFILIRAIWLVAMVTHTIALLPILFTPSGLDLAFLNAGSTIMLLISAVLFFNCLYKPLDLVAAWILPLTAMVILMNLFVWTGNSRIVAAGNLTIQLHIVSSMLAYSLLIMAAAIAIVFHLQNRLLHQGRLTTSFRILPPLDAIESFLFHLLTAGMILLSISLLSGWLYHENLFAQHLVHKTVLSVAAWLLLAILISGRRLFGWRERKVVQFIVTSTMLLLLAYFGSKFVLEIILHRVA